MKFPIENKEYGQCVYCGKQLNGNFIAFIAGALVKINKNEQVMGKDNLLGFGEFHRHWDSTKTYKSVELIKRSKNGQFEFYTCSIKCMKAIFNDALSELSPQKNITIPEKGRIGDNGLPLYD